jgi:hypothetical protein
MVKRSRTAVIRVEEGVWPVRRARFEVGSTERVKLEDAEK